MIYDEESFTRAAKTFYDNSECNSQEEFEQDLARLVFIGNHFNRFDKHGVTNFSLLMNHFISFVNCFGVISEQMLKYKHPGHITKINSMFVLIGHKKFDGTTKIHEDFFINLSKVF